VTDWAKNHENVRVVIITSSRADPRWTPDELSDYDVEVFVRDLEPFIAGDEWLRVFGETMVKNPHKQELAEVIITAHPDGSRKIDGNAGCMVIFDDEERIDFGIFLVSVIEDDIRTHGGYWNDMGYRILVDKDGMTEGAVPPTYQQYDTEPPSEDEFLQAVHSFWWNITYLPKCLYRDQLFFAQRMLNSVREGPLTSVLSWHIGMRRGWKNNPGVHGKHFKEQVDADLWRELEGVFAGAALTDNWRATFKVAEVFSRLAAEVGEGWRSPIQRGWPIGSPATSIRSMSAQMGDCMRSENPHATKPEAPGLLRRPRVGVFTPPVADLLLRAAQCHLFRRWPSQPCEADTPWLA